jgi:Lrp/AsnC family transcriptional regulator, regulator for asnA, asnC and gidA
MAWSGESGRHMQAPESDTRVDALDRRIIGMLQSDGRRPFAEIGRALGVSEGTIRMRYQRLVSSGVLQVVGIPDPFKVGLQSMAMIGVNVAIDGTQSVDDVANCIAQFDEVSYVVMSTGDFDLLVEVMVESSEDLASFLTHRLHPVQGVARTETFVLLRIYKFSLGGYRAVVPLE